MLFSIWWLGLPYLKIRDFCLTRNCLSLCFSSGFVLHPYYFSVFPRVSCQLVVHSCLKFRNSGNSLLQTTTKQKLSQCVRSIVLVPKQITLLKYGHMCSSDRWFLLCMSTFKPVSGNIKNCVYKSLTSYAHWIFLKASST